MNQPPSESGNTIVIRERRGRWWSRIGWIGFIICLLIVLSRAGFKQEYYDRSEGIQEKYFAGAKTADDKIAVLHVSGVILSGDGFAKRQIDRISQDTSVKGIVVRINSPGGTITGSDYIYHHLSELRKARNLPMVVSMGSVAASGGYYIAMATGAGEDLIYAEPTTTTGSIGVIIPYYNISELMAKVGVSDESIVSHPLKNMLSMTHPISEEERRIAQAYVNESFVRFKRIILQSRPHLKGDEPDSVVDPQTKEDLATGQIFTAEQAKEHGLIDEIGFIEDAIARVREMAGLTENNSRVVEYRQPAPFAGLLGGAEAQSLFNAGVAHHRNSTTAWWEATTPQAYYLATTLPAMIHSFAVRP